MRITTNSIVSNYKSSLMRSTQNMNTARDKVLTQRNFSSYAEDPSAAAQAFKLRRRFSRTSDQINNVSTQISRHEAAWNCVGSVKNIVNSATNEVALRANSDGSAGGRQALSKVLSGYADSIVQTLNTKLGDSYIFAGSDGKNVPFSLGDNGRLLFRGIAVDCGDKATRPMGTPQNPREVEAESEWGVYYANNPDFAKLMSMTYETSYIDIGSGITEYENGNIVSSSAFDSAISGLNLLGFGWDGDGDPCNAVSLIQDLEDIFERCDYDTGAYANSSDQVAATRLTEKLQKALGNITNEWTGLDSKAAHLGSTKDRLIEHSKALNEQILSIEQVDMADAITEYSWAEYCYNAALQVGNKILSQTLIDYMK